MTEEDLNGTEIASRLVDDRCFRAPKRVRPVILPTQANAGDPLVSETGILLGVDVSSATNRFEESRR